MPTWLKLACLGVVILLSMVFMAVQMQKPAHSASHEPRLSQTQLDRMNRSVESIFEGTVGAAVFVTCCVLYLLPTVISILAKHRNLAAVILANILLGWTGVGWALALIWACMANQHGQPRAPVVST